MHYLYKYNRIHVFINRLYFTLILLYNYVINYHNYPIIFYRNHKLFNLHILLINITENMYARSPNTNTTKIE
jgi:hypothetical protein